MREFLVTRFICARCGNNLRMGRAAPGDIGHYSAGEPTRADIVEQRVVIEPCDCVTRPFEELRRAVGRIVSLGDKAP